MKKSFLSILTILILAILVSCTSTSSKNIEVDENKKCEIEFYVYDNASAYRNLAKQFNQIYPNWTINVREDKSNYFDHLKTYFGAGMAPDMFFMEPGEIASFLRDECLFNLQPLIEASDSLKEEDLWEANNGYRYNYENGILGDDNGDLYALAKDLSADFLMIYNKDHIDEYNETHEKTLIEVVGYPSEDGIYPSETVPMTWAQNEEFCYQLAKFDNNGNFERYGTVFDYIPWRHVMEWVQQQGSSLFSEDGKTFNATDEKVIAAFTHLTNYCYGEKVSSTPLDVKSVDTGIGFRSQSVSVVWGGRWSFKAYNWDTVGFEIGLAPGPVRNEGDEVFTTTSFVGIGISAYSENPGVAYKFLEYILTSGVQQEIRNNASFNVPANYKIASSDAYLKPEDALQKRLNNYFYNMTKIAEPLKFSQYVDTSTMGAKIALHYGHTWSNTNSYMTPEKALLEIKKDLEIEINKVIGRL